MSQKKVTKAPATPNTPTQSPAIPEGFFRPETSRLIWWPEHHKALREAIDAAPATAVALVTDYRTRANDDERSVGGIYARACALGREGARISGPVRWELHALMQQERALRTEAKLAKRAPAIESVRAPKEADAKLPDSQENPGDSAALALVRIWRAGKLPDTAFLAALKALGV